MTGGFHLWNSYVATQSVVGQRSETVIQTMVLVERWVKASSHKRLRLAQRFQEKTGSGMADGKLLAGLRATRWHISVVEKVVGF